MTLRMISYGGGVQSSAMIVLAIQGKIDTEHAVFANVGDDSEHPASLEYVRNVMQPWAAKQGFPVHEVNRIKRDGSVETLWGHLMKEGSRSIPIPMRMNLTGAPGLRSCTADFKIAVISKWVKANGATKDDPAIVNIGISVDEIERAGRGRNGPYEHREYPLLGLGLNRSDCMNVISAAGLPVPPKSSCFFCPFHRQATWAEMRRDEPDLFEKSVLLEKTINERKAMLGRDPIWMTRFGKPLDEAIGVAQDMLPGFDDGIGETGCDEGVCFV